MTKLAKFSIAEMQTEIDKRELKKIKLELLELVNKIDNVNWARIVKQDIQQHYRVGLIQ